MTRLGWLCVLAALGAAPCAAQGRLELSPFAGLYVPAAHVVDISAFCPGGPCGEVVAQGIAPIVGVRLTAWGSDRVGLDFSLGYSRSRVTRHGLLAEIPSGVLVGRTATDTSGTASITTGSARVLIRLSPHTDRSSLYLAAGLAVVSHGGEAYSQVVGNTGWGPVVGAVGRLQLARAVTLRAQLDDYVYSFSGTAVTGPPAYSLGVVAGNYKSRLQHDLVLSLGLSVAP
jgi:hypothetical protein